MNKKITISKSVNRLITRKVPLASPEERIADIKKRLFDNCRDFETLNYVYVLDQEKKLVGVFSIKEIFRQNPEAKVSKIMKERVVSVRSRTHRERVAALSIKHNLKAIPVIEKNGFFVGVVPSDMILKILNEENVEDFLYSVGITPEEDGAKKFISASTFIHFKRRIPWLLVGLAGGILAAFVVQFFEEALKVQLILALFIPLVVYMADAVGAQTQTLYIRSIAIETNLQLKKYILREIKVGLSLATILGIIITGFSIFYWKVLLVGFILGVSIFITVLTAMVIAVFLPWLFSKMKQDPAVASGPFATVIRDILSLLVYFSVAQIFLNIFS